MDALSPPEDDFGQTENIIKNSREKLSVKKVEKELEETLIWRIPPDRI